MERDRAARELRVLYMHDLGQGPKGPKASYLAMRCRGVLAPDMEVSRLHLHRKRSILREVLAQPPVWGMLGLCTAGAVMLTVKPTSASKWHLPFGAASLLLGLCWMAIEGSSIVIEAVRMCVRDCVEDVMAEAVKRFEPDVVVGSSWGGAIVCCAIEMGIWAGPTLLLAPAYHRLCTMMGGPLEEGLEGGPSLRSVVIVHSKDDKVVPFRDSVWLAKQLGGAPGVKLIELKDGGHRLECLLDERQYPHTLVNLVEDVYNHFGARTRELLGDAMDLFREAQ